MGAVAGGYLAGTLPDTLLLLVITFVLVQAGIDLLRRPLKPSPRRSKAPATASTSAPPR